VTLADGMTEIGSYAFASSTGNEQLKELVLPSTVTTISAGAFYGCTALKTINLTNVEEIGDYAFYGCSALQSTDLSKVETIGSYAFAGAKKMRTAEMTNVTSIGNYAFYQSGISTVSVPAVKSIGDGAFANISITTIDLPTSLTTLGTAVFSYDSSLKGISVAEENEKFFVDPLYTNSAYGVLYSYVADGNYQLEAYPAGYTAQDYSILEGTVRLNELSFAGNESLTSVTSPVSLLTIGDKAFYDCTATKFTFRSYNAPILESRYVNGYAYGSDSWFYKTFYESDDVEQRYYANFNYYLMYQVGGYDDFDLELYYPANAKGYTEYIWSLYFDTAYTEADTINEATMAAVKAVQALPDLSEINSLIEKDDRTRAVEITELLKTARTLYSYILDDTQLAYFTGNYDGNNYQEILTTAEAAMKPVKTHFNIITSVSGISLVSAPTKLTYAEGETLDFTGLSIKVMYDDGSEKYVTADDCTFSTTTANKANTRINVYYEENGTTFSKYFRITVTDEATDTPEPGNGDSSNSGDSSTDSSTEKKGLPGGAIAGIIVGGVVVLLAGGFAVYHFVLRKKLH
jgi:hypothetical protein